MNLTPPQEWAERMTCGLADIAVGRDLISREGADTLESVLCAFAFEAGMQIGALDVESYRQGYADGSFVWGATS